jgi:hypothetical protein
MVTKCPPGGSDRDAERSGFFTWLNHTDTPRHLRPRSRQTAPQLRRFVDARHRRNDLGIVAVWMSRRWRDGSRRVRRHTRKSPGYSLRSPHLLTAVAFVAAHSREEGIDARTVLASSVAVGWLALSLAGLRSRDRHDCGGTAKPARANRLPAAGPCTRSYCDRERAPGRRDRSGESRTCVGLVSRVQLITNVGPLMTDPMKRVHETCILFTVQAMRAPVFGSHELTNVTP